MHVSLLCCHLLLMIRIQALLGADNAWSASGLLAADRGLSSFERMLQMVCVCMSAAHAVDFRDFARGLEPDLMRSSAKKGLIHPRS